MNNQPDIGMTLRDYFAAKAMQGICSTDLDPRSGATDDVIAVIAYHMADAMMKAREQ